MEFHFDINKIFKDNISRIGPALLPAGFEVKNRLAAIDAATHVAEVIDKMGHASADAQDLLHPVTSADRLRNADDQVVYLMTEREKKTGDGVVVGMLKIGSKSLYVCDKFGETYQVDAPCVLDFYVHETRQRVGLGKQLFDYMLEYENLLPQQLAIDRPNEKLLAFLRKHYALTEKVPQANNFVINDGFFAALQSQRDQINHDSMMTIAPSSDLDFVRCDAYVDGMDSLAEEDDSPDAGLNGNASSVSPVSSNEEKADAAQEQAEQKQMQQYEQHEEKYYNHADDMHQDSHHRDYFVHPRARAISPFQYNKHQMESLSKEVESLDMGADEDAQSVSPVSSDEEKADAAQERAEEKQMQQYEQHEEKYYNHADDMHQDAKHRDYFVHPRDRSISPFQYNKQILFATEP